MRRLRHQTVLSLVATFAAVPTARAGTGGFDEELLAFAAEVRERFAFDGASVRAIEWNHRRACKNRETTCSAPMAFTLDSLEAEAVSRAAAFRWLAHRATELHAALDVRAPDRLPDSSTCRKEGASPTDAEWAEVGARVCGLVRLMCKRQASLRRLIKHELEELARFANRMEALYRKGLAYIATARASIAIGLARRSLQEASWPSPEMCRQMHAAPEIGAR